MIQPNHISNAMITVENVIQVVNGLRDKLYCEDEEYVDKGEMVRGKGGWRRWDGWWGVSVERGW